LPEQPFWVLTETSINDIFEIISEVLLIYKIQKINLSDFKKINENIRKSHGLNNLV